MLNLGIIHEIHDSVDFSVKCLFFFTETGKSMLPQLRQRVVATEDQMLSQIRTNKQAHADAAARHIQLDWRMSVAEVRLAAAEKAIRRGLAAQMLLMAALLAALAAHYMPVGPLWLGRSTGVLAAVVIFVALVETSNVCCEFVAVKVCHGSKRCVAVCEWVLTSLFRFVGTCSYSWLSTQDSWHTWCSAMALATCCHSARVSTSGCRNATVSCLQIDYHAIAKAITGQANLSHATEPVSPDKQASVSSSGSLSCATLACAVKAGICSVPAMCRSCNRCDVVHHCNLIHGAADKRI
jgi:hypothetical protein